MPGHLRQDRVRFDFRPSSQIFFGAELANPGP